MRITCKMPQQAQFSCTMFSKVTDYILVLMHQNYSSSIA